MKVVVAGVFNKDLPWNWIYMGIILGTIIIIIDYFQEKRNALFRFPVLAVAVGLYLPFHLVTPIFIGGLISFLTSGKTAMHDEGDINQNGLLFASGLITGEAIMGIIIALPIFLSGISNWWKPIIGFSSDFIGIILFILLLILLYKITSNNEE